jgi:hypothetical protein
MSPGAFSFYLGDVLLSHAVASAVPSGLRGLTAVFGMGTGVTPSLQSPKIRDLNYRKIFGPPTNPRSPSRDSSLITCHSSLLLVNFMVKPNGRLVTVSFTCRHASTSVLSSRSSSCALIRDSTLGRSHLGEGFTLICCQRLSLPNFATQPCHWRDNWNTRGSSTSVLSY